MLVLSNCFVCCTLQLKVVREIKNWFETTEEQPVIVLRFLGKNL